MVEDGTPLPVDRLHNLENLLGMYEYNPLIVLVNEAIANAVDAFRENKMKSGNIDIKLIRKNNQYGYISFHNNAPPMTENQFYGKYHHVSFSFKQKGQGIGFAGVGAKIFLVSDDGGEIITVTGKSKHNFMASKMFRTVDDVKFKTTKDYPLSEILTIPNYTHTSGTTYSARLTNNGYDYYKERLPGLIQFWWNFGLLSKQIRITINGKQLSGWEPRGDKYKKIFNFKKNTINSLCYIAKETIPEERLHIVYTVFGKRIYNQQINLARVKPDYAHRVFCIVDVSFLADQLISNKENFKKSPFTNECRHQLEKQFWDFLSEHGLVSTGISEPKREMLKNELTRRLEDLFNTKEFNQLNPFLTSRKLKNPTLDKMGDTSVSEIPGSSIGEGVGKGTEGDKAGIDDGTAFVKDKDGTNVAKMKERKSKGLHIIYDDGLQKHEEEAIVSVEVGAVIIDTQHPFWLRCKTNHTLGNFNEMRIVIEALMKYKNDEIEWDVKETLEKYRNLLHKTWV
tara:strand:+ start:1177 stop:2706 length:1530 start_codon:yes stop_codon:yes gene_type:complete